MSVKFTVRVPHLFGIDAACQMAKPYDAAKPTCVLINSCMMSSELFRPQFEHESLVNAMNLLAIEPLGHGGTKTNSLAFSFWDTAIMNLQVLEALKIPGKVFAAGTGQGGWIVARMALLAPHRMAGIIPVGTSMDYESPQTRALGSSNAISVLTPTIDRLQSETPTPNFVAPNEICALAIYTGFGWGIELEEKERRMRTVRASYQGDEGRLRLKQCLLSVRDRDGLLGRLSEITCPVMWLHGSRDAAYSVATVREQIKLFVNSPHARLAIVDKGEHYLNASNPAEVNSALLEFVARHHQR